MTELEWRRIENRLVAAHRAASPALAPAVWRGVEARLAAPVPSRRRAVALAIGAAVAIVAGALWWTDRAAPAARLDVATVTAAAIERVRDARPAVAPVRAPDPPAPVPAPVLNQVLETRGARTFVIAADAGRLELEPCRGRFINVTVLGSPHRRLELRERGGRVEVAFDGGAELRGGVVHILVPADTHVIATTRSAGVVVRGLGAALELTTVSGELQIDTAPRLDPVVTARSTSGAITWSGRCGRGCRVDARSETGEITVRTPVPAALSPAAVRAESASGRVHFEELTCRDSRCASPPLPWRAAGLHP